MPEYSLSGQLCFTTQDPRLAAKLKSEGFPVVGTRVEISMPFQAYDIEAQTVGQAAEVFRQRINALKDGEHMGITGVYTHDWSRGDLLHGYERQLAHYTPAEIANPDIIMEGFGPNVPADSRTFRLARQRYRKLRRALGLRTFVQANPNLNLKYRHLHAPLSHFSIHLPHCAVTVTYSTVRNRVHLVGHGVDVYIQPADTHGLESALQQAEVASQAHFYPSSDSQMPIADEDIPFLSGKHLQRRFSAIVATSLRTDGYSI